MERPLQSYRQWQSLLRHPDFRAGGRLRFVHGPAAVLQLRHKPLSFLPWRQSSVNVDRSDYKFVNRNSAGSGYFPSSVDRTFLARLNFVNGFCSSCTPGSSTLCCTTISSVYSVMYMIMVCGRFLKMLSAKASAV